MTVPSLVAEVSLLSTWLVGLPSSCRSRGVSPGGKSCPGEISPKEGTSTRVVLLSKQQALLGTGGRGKWLPHGSRPPRRPGHPGLYGQLMHGG